MKPVEYLKFYKDCMKGRQMGVYKGEYLPFEGLCNCFRNDPLLDLLTPSIQEQIQLSEDGYSPTYWGSELKRIDHQFEKRYQFTPLRQTIVLFMYEMSKDERLS